MGDLASLRNQRLFPGDVLGFASGAGETYKRVGLCFKLIKYVPFVCTSLFEPDSEVPRHK